MRAARREPLDVDLATSGLLHIERERYTAVLRGATRGSSNLFGCDVGGGSLQSLVVLGGPRQAPAELVDRRRFQRERAGSFLVRPAAGPGRLAGLRRLAKDERSDLRFRLYVASMEFKARHGALRGLLYPFKHMLVRSWREASPWWSSHLDLETRHEYDGREVRFTGAVADRWGARLPGTRTERTYGFEDDGVTLVDVLELDDVSGQVRYLVPEGFEVADVTCEGGALTRGAGRVEVAARGGHVRLEIRGRWPTH